MPLYEVFIPAKPGTDSESVTVEVEASSWLLALRSGMLQIGEQGEALASIMCENRPDGTVVVKDPTSRRMFRIREISGSGAVDEAARQEQEARQRRLRDEAEKVAAERDAAKRAYEESLARRQEAEERARQEHEEARRRAAAEAERKQQEEAARAAAEAERKQQEEAARAAAEAERKQQEEAARAAAEAERKRQEEAARAAIEAARQSETARRTLEEVEVRAANASRLAAESAEGQSRDVKVTRSRMDAVSFQEEDDTPAEYFDLDEVLADLFMEMMDVTVMPEREASSYALDLALRLIKAEAGSVILSDFNSTLQDLYFVAAKGKVADQLKAIRIPRGKGIVGFCVQIGCPLAVSDVNQNPNFYRAVSEKTGYETRSILCVPVQHGERTFGAIELINKVGSDRWTPGELNVVHFLGQKLGEHLFSIAERVKLE